MIAKKSSNGKEGGMFRVHRVLAFSERARAKSTQRKLGLKGHITLRNSFFSMRHLLAAVHTDKHQLILEEYRVVLIVHAFSRTAAPETQSTRMLSLRLQSLMFHNREGSDKLCMMERSAGTCKTIQPPASFSNQDVVHMGQYSDSISYNSNDESIWVHNMYFIQDTLL